MTDARDARSERARELSQLWQSTVVPLEEEASTEAREARVVAALGATIARAAVRRGHERRMRHVAIAAALAAAVALAVGLGGRFRGGTVASQAVAAEVDTVTGTVTLMHGATTTSVERASLVIGDHLSTNADQSAELRLSRLVRARVDGSTGLSLMAAVGSVHRLRLDQGAIHAQVDDHPSPIPKLVVETPNVEVVVTGTIFEVSVVRDASAAATTRVAVKKGRIVVRSGGAEIAAVTAGESWSSAPVEAPVDAPSAERARDEGANRGASTDSRGGALAEQNRLFQAAVDARNGGDDRATIARLSELLTRYPASPLAREARVERMRALSRAGLARDAAREAVRYLADYPDGFARDEATRLLNAHGARSVASDKSRDSNAPPSENFPDQ